MTRAAQQQRAEKLQWNSKELHVKLQHFDSCRISIFRGGGSGSSRLQKTICTFSFQITGRADLLKSLAVFGNCHKSADVVWRYQSRTGQNRNAQFVCLLLKDREEFNDFKGNMNSFTLVQSFFWKVSWWFCFHFRIKPLYNACLRCLWQQSGSLWGSFLNHAHMNCEVCEKAL